MCGIVGYIGDKDACAVLLSGLEKLEYRGYDSAGISVIDGGRIAQRKYKGGLDTLKANLDAKPVRGFAGIGHTRWATHGAPSDINSHPHTSEDGKISVVHNGIIENYAALKQGLIAGGVSFQSDTDTEVASHLIRKYYKGNLLEAVSKAVKELKGAYALGIVCSDEPDKIIAVRKDSPLVIGIGDGENFIASDIPAILEYTRRVYLIDDGTIAEVTKDGVKLFDSDLNPISKEIYNVEWSAADATKGGYKHFMMKEIWEQPSAVKDTMRSRLDENSLDVNLEPFFITKEEFEKISRIYITACGTAYYAGCVGKYMIEKYARKAVDIEIASEFRYKDPIIDENTLFIAVSQSGETADTLACLRLAKQKGAKILAITNVVGSVISRESQNVLYTWAGPEIAVASTKAYSTQVVCMYMLALKFGKLSGKLSEGDFIKMRDACLNIPDAARNSLENNEPVKKTAGYLSKSENIFFIGRGLDYCLALEGALKMKEISYIHAEAYQGGELKHGPIALIEKGTPVVAICTQKGELLDKMITAIKEVKARGAYVIALTQKGVEQLAADADQLLYIEDAYDDATAIPAIIQLQYLAYYTADLLGQNIDKPRNLAKTVTVE